MSAEIVLALGLLMGVIAIPVGGQALFTAMRGKRLAGVLERLYRGDMSAMKECHYLDVNPRALCFPFSAGDLETIARCRDVSRHTLHVTPIHTGQRFWNGYYFHVTCDFQGKDSHGSPIEIKRAGYLYIECRSRNSYFAPVICHVEQRKKDFPM